MTPEQAAAYVHAQSVCALAEIEAMKAANVMRARNDYSPAYGEDEFNAVADKYLLHHNSVCELFTAANR